MKYYYAYQRCLPIIPFGLIVHGLSFSLVNLSSIRLISHLHTSPLFHLGFTIKGSGRANFSEKEIANMTNVFH